ncbi:mandelate racemase/muconate lactonizing enzyme family protein [Saccharobesus litoralis]|uniref:Mandelate racemase/muconate lactonizing enzyme family protein n=1 Tax=Saccharobesus litoralis TaxID=2172099 RepID=A0A2S0VLF9_9ALTE|nr:mandelate racemase/muconate lactonizing enzyme family protein [Saccharobesus litoralis]AWB65043.1 mandelate racemase/muconate lactonizing enzyme family protein [Saccharobesus litoralis]
MKIECIRTHHLRCHLEQPFGFSQWYYDQRNVLVIEVITDEGVSGWGECYGPADVIQGAVEKFYAPRIIGMDPICTDAIWQHMWRSSLDFARAGVMMAAMSGIDMALWDLKGKALGLSVSELMGGRQRDLVPCYATGMYYIDMPEDTLMPRLIEEAKGYANEGYTAMKIKVGKNVDFDLKFIKAMREALPNTKLMADSNHAFDLPEAIKIGRALDEYGYDWFEEPLSPEYPHQFRQLHEKLDVAIATGECEQTRFGYQKLIERGGVQILQADLAYCGGPSEALKIRTLASTHGINMIPHVWGTQLNLAAATHFLATAYHEPGRKEERELLLEYDRTENPLRDELYSTMVQVSGEGAVVPTAPGLGVVIDKSALKNFDINTTETR